MDSFDKPMKETGHLPRKIHQHPPFCPVFRVSQNQQSPQGDILLEMPRLQWPRLQRPHLQWPCTACCLAPETTATVPRLESTQVSVGWVTHISSKSSILAPCMLAKLGRSRASQIQNSGPTRPQFGKTELLISGILQPQKNSEGLRGLGSASSFLRTPQQTPMSCNTQRGAKTPLNLLSMGKGPCGFGAIARFQTQLKQHNSTWTQGHGDAGQVNLVSPNLLQIPRQKKNGATLSGSSSSLSMKHLKWVLE